MLKSDMALHLLSGVFVAVILFWSTCAHAATSLNSLALVLNGPDVANYGSTVVFKCSWQADDLVFRILWRIQLAGSSVPLEYTLKNAAQSEPVSLSSAGSDGPLQGEATVDTRNNFSTLTLRNVSFVDGLYTCVVSSVTAEKLTNKSLRVVGKQNSPLRIFRWFPKYSWSTSKFFETRIFEQGSKSS